MGPAEQQAAQQAAQHTRRWSACCAAPGSRAPRNRAAPVVESSRCCALPLRSSSASSPLLCRAGQGQAEQGASGVSQWCFASLLLGLGSSAGTDRQAAGKGSRHRQPAACLQRRLAQQVVGGGRAARAVWRAHAEHQLAALCSRHSRRAQRDTPAGCRCQAGREAAVQRWQQRSTATVAFRRPTWLPKRSMKVPCGWRASRASVSSRVMPKPQTTCRAGQASRNEQACLDARQAAAPAQLAGGCPCAWHAARAAWEAVGGQRGWVLQGRPSQPASRTAPGSPLTCGSVRS